MPGPQPSSVSILSMSVTLTDPQIQLLPTTPVVIVPATETLNYSGLPTQLPLPIAFSVFADTSAGAYINVGVDSLYVLALGSDWSWNAMQSPVGLMPQLSVTKTQVGIANTYDSAVSVASQILPLRIEAGNLFDNALAIAINNAGGNLTGGNSANNMKITVFYTVIDL